MFNDLIVINKTHKSITLLRGSDKDFNTSPPKHITKWPIQSAKNLVITLVILNNSENMV